MDDTVARDTAEMVRFARKLSDFCDSLDHRAATLLRECDRALGAMKDQNGPVLAQRLSELAGQLKQQVAVGRALADRINRSAALLEQSEGEE